MVTKERFRINKIQAFIDKNKNLSHIEAKEIVKIENRVKTTIYKFHCNKCNDDFICTGNVILREAFLKNGLCHPLPLTKEQIYINKIQIFIDKNKNLSHIELKEIVELKDNLKATIFKFHCNKCNEDFECSDDILLRGYFLRVNLCHPHVLTNILDKDQTYITKIQEFIDKNKNLNHIEIKEVIEVKNNVKDTIYKFHCNKCNEDFECSGFVLLNEAFLQDGLCHPLYTKEQLRINRMQAFIDMNENLNHIEIKEIIEFKNSTKDSTYKFHCNKCNEDFICTGNVILGKVYLKRNLCHPDVIINTNNINSKLLQPSFLDQINEMEEG